MTAGRQPARASLPPDGTCREKAWRVPVPLGVPHASDTRLTPTQVSGGRRSVGLGLWEKLLIHCSPQQWRGGLGSPRRTACRNQPGRSLPVYKLGVTPPALPPLSPHPHPREDEGSKRAGRFGEAQGRDAGVGASPWAVFPVSCLPEEEFGKRCPSCGERQ